MKILHTESGFTKQELLSFKPVVFNNCFSSMKAIWNFCQKVKIELDEENLVRKFDHFLFFPCLSVL